MMTIAAGISATKTGFDLIKGLREVIGRPDVNPGDVQARLIELQALMLDAQRALGDAEEENRQLKRSVEDLQRVADFGKEFIFPEGVYWHRDYPYCPNCWDAERKPTRLDGPFANSGGVNARWQCSAHKSVFYLKRRTNQSIAPAGTVTI